MADEFHSHSATRTHAQSPATVQRIDLQEKYCKIAICFIILGGIFLGLRNIWIWVEECRVYKNPEKIFELHHEELDRYIARLKAGVVKPVSDIEHCIPQFLIDRGATRVYWKNGSGTIVFFIGPVDAVPQLEYSSTGFDKQEMEKRRANLQ